MIVDCTYKRKKQVFTCVHNEIYMYRLTRGEPSPNFDFTLEVVTFHNFKAISLIVRLSRKLGHVFAEFGHVEPF